MRGNAVTKKASIVVLVVLVVAVAILGYTLTTLPKARYEAGYQAGIKQGEKNQIEIIKQDRHKGLIPDLIGQNVNQVGYWSFGGDSRIEINRVVNLGLKYKTPNGEEVTESNANQYKVISQEPKAGTLFAVEYETTESGKEYDNLVKSQGVENIILTVEKINSQ